MKGDGSQRRGRGRHGTAVWGLLGVLLAGVATAQGQAAQDVRAEVRLEPDDVLGRDEIAILEIEVSTQGAQVPSIPDPVFELDNFRIVGGPSQRTGLTILNGRPTASRALSWQLKAKKLGKARVHSVRVMIEDQVLRLEDREVTVVEEAPPSRRRRASNDPFDRLFDRDPWSDSPFERPRRDRRTDVPKIFLQAEVSPRRPWVGQQVVYTLNLFTQVNIESVNPAGFPDFKGFWALVVPQPENARPEMVDHDGDRYGRVVLLERALFPRRAGTFEIEAIEAQMVARLPDPGPFGSLLPRRREISRTSNPVTVDVRELPPGPPGFNGLVGQVELSADLEPQALEVGEAATFTVKLSGRGHFGGLAAPEIPELPGLQVFPPQQQSSEEIRGKTVVGERTWSYVLVPQRSGEWQLDAIEIPYFDPRRGAYDVASTQPISLVVRGSTSVAQTGGEKVELHSIRTAALPAVEGGLRSLAAAVPWLFVLPWAVAAGVVVLRRRGAGSSAWPARRRLLARLDEAAGEERPRQAAASIEEAWRDFLNERFDIPPGTPSTQWGELLRARGVASAHADDLVRLADDLHYLRYAPKLSSVEELRQELVERSRRLVKGVR